MDWQRLGGNIIGWCLWQCWQASLFGVRLARKKTIQLMPKPSSQQPMLGHVGITIGVWALIFAFLGVLTANSGVIIWGGIIGTAVGAYCALGVYNHGLLHIAAGGDAIHLGKAKDRYGVEAPVAIDRESRVRHMAVFGATGSGKSTALKNIVLQDAAAPDRPGILCIDIKDDFALSLIEQIPADRQEDMLLFDPTDREHPPAFNPLADIDPKERALAAAEMLGALKRLYGDDSWGPRLEHVLRHVLLTLVETPNATLLDINRILTDAQYREYALSHVTNFSVQAFWANEFDSIVGKGGSLANVASLLNKLSVFSYPEVRNVIGQTKRGLDFDQVLAEGKIVMAHLPQGVLGEDISHFFAALLVGKVQLAAQRRVQLAHRDRTTFYVFADEFQNYDTSAFTKLITEGRSMGIGLVVACQFREQLPSELRLAVEKNCAYGLFCARQNQRHTIEVVKLQEPDARDAVRIVTAAPPAGGRSPEQGVAVRQQSRVALATPVQQVEAAILKRTREQRTPTVTVTETLTTVILEEELIVEMEPATVATPIDGEAVMRNGHAEPASNGHTPNVEPLTVLRPVELIEPIAGTTEPVHRVVTGTSRQTVVQQGFARKVVHPQGQPTTNGHTPAVEQLKATVEPVTAPKPDERRAPIDDTKGTVHHAVNDDGQQAEPKRVELLAIGGFTEAVHRFFNGIGQPVAEQPTTNDHTEPATNQQRRRYKRRPAGGGRHEPL